MATNMTSQSTDERRAYLRALARGEVVRPLKPAKLSLPYAKTQKSVTKAWVDFHNEIE
jgi:hypothetical protein